MIEKIQINKRWAGIPVWLPFPRGINGLPFSCRIEHIEFHFRDDQPLNCDVGKNASRLAIMARTCQMGIRAN